jgi:Tfp pilus assembly protein PilN
VEAALANYVPASVRVTSVSLAPGTLTVQGTQR